MIIMQQEQERLERDSKFKKLVSTVLTDSPDFKEFIPMDTLNYDRNTGKQTHHYPNTISKVIDQPCQFINMKLIKKIYSTYIYTYERDIKGSTIPSKTQKTLVTTMLFIDGSTLSGRFKKGE